MASSTLKPPDLSSLSNSPRDSVMVDNQQSSDLPVAPSPVLSISFREAVAISSEWFPGAKNFIQSSCVWDDPLPIAHEAPNVVNFSKDEFSALRQPC